MNNLADLYASILVLFVYVLPFCVAAALFDWWWGGLTEKQQEAIKRKVSGLW